MNRRRADLAAGLLVGAVVLVGLLFTWDAYARRRTFQDGTGGMMGGSGMMGSMMYSGPDPVWYLAGTLIIGVGLLGGYALLRSTVDFEDAGLAATAGSQAEPAGAGEQDDLGSVSGSGTITSDDAAAETGQAADRSDQHPNGDEASGPGAGPAGPDILAVLPDDERRVLEPVVESPGLTQIALRDRSGFSKSKVSQTVSELEKRGLIYREKQGRTFRVYPADDLADE